MFLAFSCQKIRQHARTNCVSGLELDKYFHTLGNHSLRILHGYVNKANVFLQFNLIENSKEDLE